MQNLVRISLALICCLSILSASYAQDKGKSKKLKESDSIENRQTPKIEKFWFIMLKTGPKQDFDSVTKAKLFEGHAANIKKLYYDGILKVAGPFGKNDFSWRGLFIFDCKTKEEAEKMVATDPAVEAGIFAYDIVPWYGEPTGNFEHGKPTKPSGN